ncbi:MAG TPA: methyl-accepting chemotaxis protein, partial [Ktedonobacterales bacterium]
SSEAAKQVAARIKSIQNETNSVVVSMEQSTQQVVMQSELVAHAGAALQAMDAITQRIAQHIEGISTAAAQQATASGFMDRSMSDLSQIAVYITQQISKMHTSTTQLTELAESLQRRLNVFHLAESAQPRPESLLNRTSGPISTPRPNKGQEEMRKVTVEEEGKAYE